MLILPNGAFAYQCPYLALKEDTMLGIISRQATNQSKRFFSEKKRKR